MSEDDNVFSRWSRRKRRAAVEEPSVPEPTSESLVESEPVPEPEPETQAEEAALLERLNLPIPESLKVGDDFSVFMRTGVPEFLRRRALRVLWRSNPVLANLDGLNDYDDDFTSPELTKKVLATGYKVGRGFLRDVPEPEVVEENDTVQEEEEVVAEAETAAPESPDTRLEDAENQEISGEFFDLAETEKEDTFRPRRMRFET